MKKDEMSIKMKKYYAEIIPSNYLLKGMYVARLNYKEERIDNKYIVVETSIVYYGIRPDIKSVKVTCYDFIENKIVSFDGNACDFIRADTDANNNDDFCYKYKFTPLSVYKKLRLGDEVVFISPENMDSIETQQNPVFKIVKKQKKEADYGRYDLLDDTGYVLHNIPSMLLAKFDKEPMSSNHKFNCVIGGGLLQMMDKKVEKNEKKRTVFPAEDLLGRLVEFEKPKTPSKLKFSIDIDYSDDAPIEILFKDDNENSYSRKALMCDVPLDEKIEISNMIKDVFKKIFYNEDENIKKIKEK